MARIPYPDPASVPPEMDALLRQIPRHGPVDMLSHTPALGRLFLMQGQALITSIELSARHREIIILTVAALTECDYEFTQHVPISEAAGVDSPTREAIRAGEFTSADLSEDDRALIAFIKEIAERPRASDQTFQRIRPLFADREIVEIIQIVGAYWSFARLCTTLDIEIQEAADLRSAQALEHLNPQV
jgi:alkylhydroperoxidase family enzyme